MMAPPLVGSNRVLGHRDYVIKTLLHGMTGPLDGRNYGVMVPMGANSDEWVASVASYIRSGFGTTDWFIAPADVAKARADTANRTTPWTVAELEANPPARAGRGCDVESQRQPQPRRRRGRSQLLGLVERCAADVGHVVPNRAAVARVAHRNPIRIPATDGGRGAPPVDTYPRNYQVQISEDGQQWSAPVARGNGSGSPIADQLRADAWKVHPHLADGVRPRRSDVDNAKHPAIRGAGSEHRAADSGGHASAKAHWGAVAEFRARGRL